MATFSGPFGVALQNPVALLNISFIVPMTFVPMLALYESNGHLFDFETVSIPFTYVNLETLPTTLNPLYGRIEVSGARLRSLVCAFGVVSLDEKKLEEEDEGISTCFGQECTETVFWTAIETLSGTKAIFGPQFNLFFLKDSARPEQLYLKSDVFTELLPDRIQNTDSFLYFFNVPTHDTKTDTSTAAPSEAIVVCLACNENWGIWKNKAGKFYSEHFKYYDSQSFWDAMLKAADITTSQGRKLHWTYDVDYLAYIAEGYSWKKYQQYVNQKSLYSFLPVDPQFVFSLFETVNATKCVEKCSENSLVTFHGDGIGSLPEGAFSLELIGWNPSETFDEAFMFITDQNVTSKRHAADLYLKAFDAESWIAVLVAGGVTCCALAMLVKTSKMKLLSGFWDSMRYLGAYFLDQCPSTLPFPDAAVRSKKALLFVVVPWMMAMLILSNGFRGIMKSNYVSKFPYETNLDRLEDFEVDMDLFTFARNEDCDEYQIETFVNEAWVWWAANGRQSKDWCHDEEPEGYSVWILLQKDILGNNFQELRIDEWCLLNERLKSNTTQDRYIGFPPPEEYFRDNVALVCVTNFSQYSGLKYHQNVDKWHYVALQGPKHWSFNIQNHSPDFMPCDDSIKNYTFKVGATNYEDVLKAFWMTRRHESAFVIRKSEFPWYWNLFKKAMVNDSQVQFAHTGGAEVTRKTKRAIYERNDSPFYVFVKHRYMEPAKWVIRRIAAIQESGIFNLWHKWDMILRPPVKESLNEEVSETFDEVRELRLSDPGIWFLVNVVALLMLAAGAVFTLEIVSNFI